MTVSTGPETPPNAGSPASKESLASEADHPSHYGGEAWPYEVIKIIEAWGLNFNKGNALKYLLRAGLKHAKTPRSNDPETNRLLAMKVDLEKGLFYLKREIDTITRMLPEDLR